MPLALINANPENITLDAIALAVDESMQEGGKAFNSIVCHSGDILKELLIKRGLYEVGQAKCIKLKATPHKDCTESACDFPVISHKNSLKYDSIPASFLCNLTKKSTAHLRHNLCAVLP